MFNRACPTTPRQPEYRAPLDIETGSTNTPASPARNMRSNIKITLSFCFATLSFFAASAIATRMVRFRLDARVPIQPFAQRMFDIKNCTSSEASTLTRAHENIARRIEDIVNPDVVNLTAQERTQLTECFEKEAESCAAYVCADSCYSTASSAVVGYFIKTHEKNNTVYFCMENIKEHFPDPADFKCKIEDTMVHEVAHYLNVEIANNHNEGPNNDKVYALGEAANAICHESLA